MMTDTNKVSCFFCEGALVPTDRGYCQRIACQAARVALKKYIELTRQRISEMTTCRYCKAASVEGKPYCERHSFTKVPCRGCTTGQVERQVGAGRPKTLCPKCVAKVAARGHRGRRGFGHVADGQDAKGGS